jgi:hypothetical protein
VEVDTNTLEEYAAFIFRVEVTQSAGIHLQEVERKIISFRNQTKFVANWIFK